MSDHELEMDARHNERKELEKRASGSAQAGGYVPRYHSKEAYGNWWVKDADGDRIVCMCNRQADSEEIARLLNGKAHNTEVCDGGRKTSEFKQDANRHSQH